MTGKVTLRGEVHLIFKRFGVTYTSAVQILSYSYLQIIDHPVGWASAYAKHIILHPCPHCGMIKGADRGCKVLVEAPAEVNIIFLPFFLSKSKQKMHELRQTRTAKRTAKIMSAETKPREFIKIFDEANTLVEVPRTDE